MTVRGKRRIRGKLESILSFFVISILIFSQVPLGIVAAQTETSGDWPSSRHDPAGTAYAADETLLTPPLEQIEFVNLFSPMISGASPILYDGSLFILEENGLCAYRLEDKSLSWCYSGLDDLLVSGVTGEDIVAVGVERGDGSVTVVRLSLNDGTVQGQVVTGVSAGDGFACSAAADGQLFCNIDSSILKVDLTGNMTAWSTLLDGNGNTTVVLGDTVFTATETTVYALSTADGSISWNISQPAGSTESLLVYGTTLIITGVDGNIYSLNTLTGVQEWTHTFHDDTPCLAAYGNGDLIVTTSAGLIEKLDTNSGAALWTYDSGSGELGTCPRLVLANGFAYTGDADGTVRTVEVSTGSLAWEGAVASPGFLPGLAVSDGQLVVTVSPLQVSLFAEVTTLPETPPVGEPLEEPLFSLSGTIVDGEGAPLTGVQLEDGQGHAALTDENGYFMFSGLPAGDYLLAPVSVDYDFSPASYPLTLFDVDLADINFTGQFTFVEDPDLTDPSEGLVTTEALTPVISGFTPESATINDLTFVTLTVSGENFVNTSEVKWGETSLITTYVSDTALTAAIPPALVAVTGQFPITVVNPELDGGTSSAVLFSVENPLPLIYALSPNHSITLPPPVDPLSDPGIILEVTGANFVDGAQVMWDEAGLDTQFISPTQLTAVVPAVLLGETGPVSITVVNPLPGGGTSAAATFAVEDFLPADGQKLAVNKVNFNWTDTPGANAYYIQMSLYSNFSRLIINGPVYVSHYHYGRALVNGKTYYWRIRARIGSTWGGWSSTRTFYSMNPPLAPVMITPNRYLTNVTEPLFSWNETINAERYQVQISPDYKFTSVLQDVIVPDNETSFTAATLEEGLYYWRVRGIDSVGVNSAWSRYRSFRIDTTPPASPPELVLPLDGAFVDTTTPSLSVKAVSDAFEYCFQLDDSVTFDDPLVNPACDSRSTSTSWTVPVEAMLGYQTYYWRALAIDAAGNISEASTTRRLNISIMQTPADSSFTSIKTPEFSWNALPEPSVYRLQVSTSPDFVPETEILIDEQLSSTIFLATTELDYGTYYLRLEVDTGSGFTGSWMPVQKFTISPVPETPLPLAPVDGVLINDKTPLLTWSEVVDLIIPVSAYEIQVGTDAAFSNLTNTGTAVGSPTYETGELLDGKYYWRVRAVNDLGAPGAWSSTADFWLDTTPVNAPPYYSPASGATVTTTTPKLTVKKVSGAAYYRFQVASEPTFADPLLVDKLGTVGLRTVSYTLAAAEALPFGPVYWRAATVDSVGNEAWGEARPLVVNILKTPKHGDTTTDSTPTFTWVGVAGALKYELQVATTASFDAGSITSYIVYPPVTSYTPGSEMTGGNYYWRMRVDNWTGFTDNWTPAFSFLVSPLIPSTPSLMAPPSRSYISDDSPKMRWVETFKVYAPQLRIKTRTIQVYLPPDYATSGKSYPVIYLNDGNTKFISGYYVDDTLEDLYSTGQIEGVIAVAIFNSANRWDEYAPNVNTHMDDVWFAYGAASSEGGEGNRYVDFLVDTLKPMIDSHYRTLPGREYTAVGAGSMGGYISLYAALREPDVFSKVMALSPAVWFGETGGAWLSDNFLIRYIKNHPNAYNDTQFFIYIGTSEWSGRRLNLSGMTYPKVWVQGVRAVQNALLDSGVPADKIYYIENPGGIHSSYSWRWWVDEAVTWFYGDLDELPDSPPEDKPDSLFRVQISSDSRFTTIVHEGDTLDGQLNYEGVTLGQGRYYWRVQTVNKAGITGSWSQTRYFDIDTEPTEPPNLYQPGANGFSYDRTPSLSVRSVSGAYQYCFQVADSPAFENILVNPDCALRSTRTSWSVPSADQLSYGEDYYWRALAIDRAGNQSDWSDSRELTISIMKTPVDHANTTDTTPTFKWSSITGGQMYHLQVDTDQEFISNPLVLDITRSPSTYYTRTTPFAAGKYYWRMRVMISGTYGDWMPVQTFTISPIPAAPRLTAPGSGTLTNDKTPLLSWDAVVDPTITGYQVQSSRSSLFTNSTLEEVTGVTTYECTAITDDGRYYWRVRAVNDLGVPGTWSSTRSIVIDTTPPNTPSLVIPLDWATVNGLPFYYWFSDITAKYHQFEFATDPGFTNIEYRTGELTVPYHILPGQKPGTYYWHTRARDAAGNWSGWSESRQVTIAP